MPVLSLDGHPPQAHHFDGTVHGATHDQGSLLLPAVARVSAEPLPGRLPPNWKWYEGVRVSWRAPSVAAWPQRARGLRSCILHLRFLVCVQRTRSRGPQDCGCQGLGAEPGGDGDWRGAGEKWRWESRVGSTRGSSCPRLHQAEGPVSLRSWAGVRGSRQHGCWWLGLAWSQPVTSSPHVPALSLQKPAVALRGLRLCAVGVGGRWLLSWGAGCAPRDEGQRPPLGPT